MTISKKFINTICICLSLCFLLASISFASNSKTIENNSQVIFNAVEITDEDVLFDRALNGITDASMVEPKEMSMSINGTQTIVPILSTTQLIKKEVKSDSNENSSYITTYICDLKEEKLPNGTVRLAAVDSYTKTSHSTQGSDLRLYTKVYWDEGTVIDDIPYAMMTKAEGWYNKLDPTCDTSDFKVRGRYSGIKLNDDGTTGKYKSYTSGWYSGYHARGSVTVPAQKLESSSGVYWWMYADAKVTLSRGNQTWTINWTTHSCNQE